MSNSNFDYSTLLSRLTSGESADAIAADLSNALNEAVAAYEAEQKAKAEAEMAATQKSENLVGILSDLVIWMKTYYPCIYDEFAEIADGDGEEIMNDAVEVIIGGLDSYFDGPKLDLDPLLVLSMLSGFSAPVKKSKSKRTEDDILNDFLNKICH